jgi:hypothetical protein
MVVEVLAGYDEMHRLRRYSSCDRSHLECCHETNILPFDLQVYHCTVIPATSVMVVEVLAGHHEMHRNDAAQHAAKVMLSLSCENT